MELVSFTSILEPPSTEREVHPSPHGTSITRVRPCLTTVGVLAIPPIMRCRQKWELFGNTVGGDVSRTGPRRPVEEIDPITDVGCNIIRTTNNPEGNVSDVIVWPSTIRPAGLIWTQRRPETILVFGECGLNPEVEA